MFYYLKIYIYFQSSNKILIIANTGNFTSSSLIVTVKVLIVQLQNAK